MNPRLKSAAIAAIASVSAFFFFPALGAEDIRARWQLESDQAAVGQSLTLSIQVDGTDAIDPPRFAVPGVRIEWLGGNPQNSTSIVSVNGNTTTTVRKSFVGAWSLKADAAGNYHIDPVELKVGGASLRLNALDWTVSAAPSDSRFFLRQSLTPETSIPGVEIEYSLVWYLGESAQNPEFNLPILDSPDIQVVESSLKKPSGDSFQVRYGGHSLSGEKGTETVKGQRYTTLSIDFKVKASKAGSYDLSGTRVTFEGAVDTRKAQDFFGNIIDEPSYRTLTAQAEPLSLVIRELPTSGKPQPFSGLIGKLSLAWEGAGKEYRVGEPIRLKLKLDGVLNKPDIDLDYMVTSALNGTDFQAGADDSAVEGTDSGKEGGGLTRAYVLRAKHSGSLRIPALKLNYFDPDSRRYGETKTAPIGISVSGAAIGGAAVLQGPAALSAGQGSVGLLPVNPPGILGARKRPWPWWLLSLPGFAAGALLSCWGLWLHSRRRWLGLERAAWIQGLSPLSAKQGREALEEGRERLRALASGRRLWLEHLEKQGKMKLLAARQAEWDAAFFSENRGGEAWANRWDEFCKEASSWK